jgi:3-isopropylmalate dehydrogenase
MYGDILSDEASEIAGSLGLAASLNAGADHGVAQAQHGSAPDIAGKNIANPYSLILSAALLLAWQGQRQGKGEFETAARAIEAAVEEAIAAHEVTADIGGRLGTREAGAALARILADPGREGSGRLGA